MVSNDTYDGPYYPTMVPYQFNSGTCKPNGFSYGSQADMTRYLNRFTYGSKEYMALVEAIKKKRYGY
eukprot:g71860.t1